MFSIIKLLYIVASMVCFASTAYAIRCKVCDSATTPDCDDPFRATDRFNSECENFGDIFKLFSSFIPGDVPFKQPAATGCLKMKYQTQGDGVVHTNRLCYWGEPSHIQNVCKGNNAGSIQSPILKQLSCDYCTDDLCNSSTTTGIMAATVMLLVGVVRLLA